MQKNSSKPKLHIRTAAPADAAALLGIYAPYVRETAVTFEYEVPSVEEFAERIHATLQRYPYLVAEAETVGATPAASDDAATPPARMPVGYAYVGPLHARPAYDWAVETSIYVAKRAHGQGVGRVLYEALEAELKRRGFEYMAAVIATPATDPDPYLTRASHAFHLRMGFEHAGELHLCAQKFGRWYNMAYMEKQLGPHKPNTPPPC